MSRVVAKKNKKSPSLKCPAGLDWTTLSKEVLERAARECGLVLGQDNKKKLAAKISAHDEAEKVHQTGESQQMGAVHDKEDSASGGSDEEAVQSPEGLSSGGNLQNVMAQLVYDGDGEALTEEQESEFAELVSGNKAETKPAKVLAGERGRYAQPPKGTAALREPVKLKVPQLCKLKLCEGKTKLWEDLSLFQQHLRQVHDITGNDVYDQIDGAKLGTTNQKFNQVHAGKRKSAALDESTLVEGAESEGVAGMVDGIQGNVQKKRRRSGESTLLGEDLGE